MLRPLGLEKAKAIRGEGEQSWDRNFWDSDCKIWNHWALVVKAIKECKKSSSLDIICGVFLCRSLWCWFACMDSCCPLARDSSYILLTGALVFVSNCLTSWLASTHLRSPRKALSPLSIPVVPFLFSSKIRSPTTNLGLHIDTSEYTS